MQQVAHHYNDVQEQRYQVEYGPNVPQSYVRQPLYDKPTIKDQTYDTQQYFCLSNSVRYAVFLLFPLLMPVAIMTIWRMRKEAASPTNTLMNNWLSVAVVNAAATFSAYDSNLITLVDGISSTSKSCANMMVKRAATSSFILKFK